MRHAIAAGAVFLITGACGTDNPANENASGEYATGELPTADTVQRESDVQIASKQQNENGDERAR